MTNINFYFLITYTEQSNPDDSDIKVKNSCSDNFCLEFDGDLPLTLRNKYFVGKDETKQACKLHNQRVRLPNDKKSGVMGDAKNI